MRIKTVTYPGTRIRCDRPPFGSNTHQRPQSDPSTLNPILHPSQKEGQPLQTGPNRNQISGSAAVGIADQNQGRRRQKRQTASAEIRLHLWDNHGHGRSTVWGRGQTNGKGCQILFYKLKLFLLYKVTVIYKQFIFRKLLYLSFETPISKCLMAKIWTYYI